jgi:hypothetical protein
MIPTLMIVIGRTCIGKAAMGVYFWEHVMAQSVESTTMEDGGWRYDKGVMTTPNITFTYRSGPSIHPATVPITHTRFVVLVLNAHSPEKVSTAKQWLDLLADMPALTAAAVIMLGNESCQNQWFAHYLTRPDLFKIKFTFMVYGWQCRDAGCPPVFAWPLGVATYRRFPLIGWSSSVADPVGARRHFQCNFLGTVYPSSSRNTLIQALASLNATSALPSEGMDVHTDSQYECYLLPRMQWLPAEPTDHSMTDYQWVLRNSDYTLCPIGFNPETYRIYEAMSYGSVPIVELPKTRTTPNNTAAYGGNFTCDVTQTLSFLQLPDAPIIWVEDWSTLPVLLESLRQQPPAVTYAKRYVCHLLAMIDSFSISADSSHSSHSHSSHSSYTCTSFHFQHIESE